MIAGPSSRFRVIGRGASWSWCPPGVGWSSLNQPFVSAFSAAEPLFGGQIHPLSFPSLREGWSTGRAWTASVALSWYFYPSAHRYGRSAHAADGIVICRLLAQTAVSLVGSSLPRCELCRLVVVVVVVDIVVLLCSSQSAWNGVDTPEYVCVEYTAEP